MDNQIPRGPENLKCPFWKKPMEEVCHKCPMWQKVRGKHPQSNEEIERWNCAIAWLPLLLLENAQRQIQTAASVDKVATEVRDGSQRSHETTAMMTGLLNKAFDIRKEQQFLGRPEQALMIDSDGSGEVKRIGSGNGGGGST